MLSNGCEHARVINMAWACPTRFCLAKDPRKGVFSLWSFALGRLFGILVMEWLIEHSFNTNRTGGHHSLSAQHFEHPC